MPTVAILTASAPYPYPIPVPYGKIKTSIGINPEEVAVDNTEFAVVAEATITVPGGSNLLIDTSIPVTGDDAAAQTISHQILLDGTPVDSIDVLIGRDGNTLVTRTYFTSPLAVGQHIVTVQIKSAALHTATVTAEKGLIRAASVTV